MPRVWKQSSARLSSIAGRYGRMSDAEIEREMRTNQRRFCLDIRSICMSVVSQDETPKVFADPGQGGIDMSRAVHGGAAAVVQRTAPRQRSTETEE